MTKKTRRIVDMGGEPAGSGDCIVVYAGDVPVACGTLPEVASALGVSASTVTGYAAPCSAQGASGSRVTARRVKIRPEDMVEPSRDPSKIRFERHGDEVVALVTGDDPLREPVAYCVEVKRFSAAVYRRRTETQETWERVFAARDVRTALAWIYGDAARAGMVAPRRRRGAA